MKYKVDRVGNKIRLSLGLNHYVSFPEDASTHEIIAGVNQLVETVVDIPVFQMVEAVIKEIQQ